MSKYTTSEVEGYWQDTPEETRVYRVALEGWDEEEDEEDETIFYYMDGKPLAVGDVISDGFVVTSIDALETLENRP